MANYRFEGMKKKIGILGATGYTGVELMKLLSRHPDFEIDFLTSEKYAGQSVTSLFPQIKGMLPDYRFINTAEAVERKADGVFSCLPHQAAAEGILPFLKNETRIVDLSADFRMASAEIYEKYYCPHPAPELLKDSVYGIPEWNSAQIKKAQIIGNPGCYPTSILLPLKPLIQNGLVAAKGIIADSKSGVSGAGKSPSETTHFVEVHESFSAYKIGDEHRHLSEINEQVSLMSNTPSEILFTPHLVPMSRGILSTVYCDLLKDVSEDYLNNLAQEFYAQAPFTDVVLNNVPKTSWVKNTNRCLFSFKVAAKSKKVIIVSVIDNLLKGASGQALQNMNIALGSSETAGLL
jgi:N-acetyl-gamma-glutamyl-phosphate reductase